MGEKLSPDRKRKKRRNWQRNKRLRERMIRAGFSSEDAARYVRESGQLQAQMYDERQHRDESLVAELRASLRQLDDKYEVQPEVSRSVRDFPSGAFETNRRKH